MRRRKYHQIPTKQLSSSLKLIDGWIWLPTETECHWLLDTESTCITDIRVTNWHGKFSDVTLMPVVASELKKLTLPYHRSTVVTDHLSYLMDICTSQHTKFLREYKILGGISIHLYVVPIIDTPQAKV